MKHSYLSLALIIPLLCQCGGYDSHFLSETDYIPVFGEDSCRYIDDNDTQWLAEPYTEASLFYEDMALIRNESDKKWGYIDDNGELLFPAVYTGATIFHENRAWVVRPDEAPCAIDSKGRLQLTLTRASKVMIFCEGMAAFAQKKGNRERWGFIDKAGNTVIEPIYKEVKPFSQGVAAVKNEKGLWGYIDNRGAEQIPARFRSAEPFSLKQQAVVASEESGKSLVIGITGDTLAEIECEELISDGEFFRIKKDGKWGWCDMRGEIIVAPRFDDSLAFGMYELAPVKINGKWGYIDRKGKLKIKRQFAEAYPFFDKLALVRTGTVYGFIDKNGHFQINPQYDRVSVDYIYQSLGVGSAFTIIESDHARYK